jgi:hypothetical protein
VPNYKETKINYKMKVLQQTEWLKKDWSHETQTVCCSWSQ